MIFASLIRSNRTILAPMAGITDYPFRVLAREGGCGVVCSEMISADALVRRSPKTLHMISAEKKQEMLSVQLFGTDKAMMADAAKMVQDSGADVIDINFGCAVKKIVKTGAGVALMRNPETAADVIQSVRNAVNIPLTIKIRTGWDKSGEQAVGIAKIAWECGVDAVTVHPRTAAQKFSGAADWALIKRIKDLSPVPVIGNGDIRSAADAIRMIHETGCDAVMVGRAAIGYPQIFKEINNALNDEPVEQQNLDGRFFTMRRYIDELINHYGEKTAGFMLRSRLGWFSKGIPFSTEFRESIKQISSKAQAIEQIELYRSFILNTFTS